MVLFIPALFRHCLFRHVLFRRCFLPTGPTSAAGNEPPTDRGRQTHLPTSWPTCNTRKRKRRKRTGRTGVSSISAFRKGFLIPFGLFVVRQLILDRWCLRAACCAQRQRGVGVRGLSSYGSMDSGFVSVSVSARRIRQKPC